MAVTLTDTFQRAYRLRGIIPQSQQQDTTDVLARLKGLKFYNWDNPNDTNTFNHVLGLPLKDNKPMPMFDYERLVFNELEQHKHVWILKATGLGITEFVLRYMLWLCLRDDALKGHQMTVVTGPRIELAITLIQRMKAMFQLNDNAGNVTFSSKETVIDVNGVHIESYPSHHLDAMRGLKDVSFIYLDEADFFPPGQQQDARNVSERYIGKSGSRICLVSTPNNPDGLFQSIEREPEQTCLYKRLRLDYTYGLNRIFTYEEIAKARQSPSFEREYNLAYLGLIGNLLSQRDIDRAIDKGRAITPSNNGEIVIPARRSMGIDPAWGSSAFAIVVTSWINSQIVIEYASEFQKADFNSMLNHVLNLIKRYGITLRNGSQVYIDAANPEFIRSLKRQLGERDDYEAEAKYYEQHSKGYEYWRDWNIVPVNFAQKHKDMLSHLKRLMEDNGGIIAINPKHEKLITALRTSTVTELKLDKVATAHDDIFDAFRLALQFYK